MDKQRLAEIMVEFERGKEELVQRDKKDCREAISLIKYKHHHKGCEYRYEDYIKNLQFMIDDAENMGLYDGDVESLQVAIKALEQEGYYKDLAQSYEITIVKLTETIAEQQSIQEPILDKIRAEIEQEQDDFMDDKDYDEGIRFGLMLAYQIIDKYRGEEE